MTKSTQTGSLAKDVAVGAGLVAVAAAALGTYMLYGAKNAAKNRKHVKAWSLKARGEVLERLEALSEVNEKAYRTIVDEVASQYKTLKNLDAKDVAEFSKELKGHWDGVAKQIKKSAGAANKQARRSVKTASKAVKKTLTK